MRTKQELERRRKTIATIILAICGVAVIYPVISMACSSLSSKTVIKTQPASLVPIEGKQVTIDGYGVKGKKYFLYNVEIDGEVKQLAYVDKEDKLWKYVNPDNPSEEYLAAPATPDDRVRTIRFNWANYPEALKKADFLKYIKNTLFILVISTFGAVLSSTLVAYGFARFPFKGRNTLFIILLATMMLPEQVSLIPSFLIYKWLGWYNTYLPLTVASFFASSAWNVFLIRQFMMGLPVELDEAAKMDGCGPFRNLFYVIIPQSSAVLITITLNTAIYWWNEYFYSLVYIQDRDLYTVSLGLQSFDALYFNNSGIKGAATMMMLVPPVILFFFFQRYFIQGTVVSGVKG